jgi:hypothetical protein
LQDASAVDKLPVHLAVDRSVHQPSTERSCRLVSVCDLSVVSQQLQRPVCGWDSSRLPARRAGFSSKALPPASRQRRRDSGQPAPAASCQPEASSQQAQRRQTQPGSALLEGGPCRGDGNAMAPGRQRQAQQAACWVGGEGNLPSVDGSRPAWKIELGELEVESGRCS